MKPERLDDFAENFLGEIHDREFARSREDTVGQIAEGRSMR